MRHRGKRRPAARNDSSAQTGEAVGCGGALCGPPGVDHELHIAVEQMEKAYQLT